MIETFIKQNLPPRFKKEIKNVKQKIEFFFRKRKVEITIGELKSKFHINNRNDSRRIKTDFEGDFTTQLITFLQEIPKNSKVVNIGAAQGLYAVFAAVAGHTVTAIEPDPSTFKDLEKNIELNKLNNIQTLNIAIGQSDDNILLHTSGSGGPAPRIGDNSGFKKSIFVEMKRFDTIFSSENTPDVVIVDIEGYEGKFLEGIGQLRPKDIFIEIHPKLLEKINSSSEEVLSILKDLGYKERNKTQRGDKFHYHFTLN